MRPLYIGASIGIASAAAGLMGIDYINGQSLTETEFKIAHSISLANLPPMPADPSNTVADNPFAAAFGKTLFNDTGLSENGKVSCATCHIEDRQFQDDLPVGHGIGATARRTMPLRGVGYASWLFWDGRKDSLWSQAMGPLESAVEHGFTRSEFSAYISANYTAQYTDLFGPLPDFSAIPAASPLGNDAQKATWKTLPENIRHGINTVFTNSAKSIAAYERTLLPIESRFDRYVSALLAAETPTAEAVLTRQEINGFRVFIGKGSCINCHSGPRLTDEFFHNTGVSGQNKTLTDRGRVSVLKRIESDPFNCLGPHSDANPNDCGDLKYMSRDTFLLTGAFKPPSLRGVADRPPYMHAGQFTTLSEVIEHYNYAPFTFIGLSEIFPLKLSIREKSALLAFLKTL